MLLAPAFNIMCRGKPLPHFVMAADGFLGEVHELEKSFIIAATKINEVVIDVGQFNRGEGHA